MIGRDAQQDFISVFAWLGLACDRNTEERRALRGSFSSEGELGKKNPVFRYLAMQIEIEITIDSHLVSVDTNQAKVSHMYLRPRYGIGTCSRHSGLYQRQLGFDLGSQSRPQPHWLLLRPLYK